MLLAFDAKAFIRALTHKQSSHKVLLLWAVPLALACDNLKLKSLDLSNISLLDSDAQGVAEIIKKCHTIEKVDVKGNQIGNDGAAHLLKAVEGSYNISLVELNVDDNVIGEA